jgi:hypothetical protein
MNRKRSPKPFARFRVYPFKDRYFYFMVSVFSTERQMHDYYKANLMDAGEKMAFDWTAITVQWQHVRLEKINAKKPETRLHRDIGEILFHRRRTGTGVVSHEMTHAALHSLSIGRLPKDKNPIYDDKLNEALCWIVGSLTRQFTVTY